MEKGPAGPATARLGDRRCGWGRQPLGWGPRRPGCGGERGKRDGSVHNGGVAEYVIITGLSGAGRSQAGATLEDLGWFVIDNMPTALITKVADLASAPGSEAERICLVVGRAVGQLDELTPAVAQLRASGARVKVLYLEASTEVLVRRYEGTRRRHPLPADSVAEAIARERESLQTTREAADVVIDTTELTAEEAAQEILLHLEREGYIGAAL